MAAAKSENLSLVVHGPGDLRLVKRGGEWGAEPDPVPWPWSPDGPARQRQRGRPCSSGHGLSDPRWLPCWGEGEGGGWHVMRRAGFVSRGSRDRAQAGTWLEAGKAAR